jgi:farnesyl diphosphate synthase
MSGKQNVLADTGSLAAFSDEATPRIVRALRQNLPLANAADSFVFNQALQDAVFPGGRRFRALLALLASELALASDADAMTSAVAVEYLHCSTLIFDDLPAMDDARERRGRACLHLRYGEGVAISVALALMNASFRVVVSGSPRDTVAAQRALREMTGCIGMQIAGQAADLAPSSNRSISHSKTSALIRLALTLGPMLSGVNPNYVEALGSFGEALGEAYQTVDDSRDIEEDMALLNRGRCTTFAIEHGREAATERAASLTARAQCDLIAKFEDLPSVYRLCEFASLLA